MKVARGLGQRGEIGGFRDGQLVHRLAVIIQRGGGDAIVAQTEIDLVQVEFEDALLRIGGLDPEAQEHFADLAVEGALVRQQEVLRHLLGDGRRALHALRALNEDQRGARDAFRIDAAVGVEILVLGRDEGLLHHRGNRGTRQVKPALAGIFGQDRAVARMDARHHRRLIVAQGGGVGKILLVMPEHQAKGGRAQHEYDRAGGEHETNEPGDEPHKTTILFQTQGLPARCKTNPPGRESPPVARGNAESDVTDRNQSGWGLLTGLAHSCQ